ncbi:hypothetical protein EZV62_005519 [Acer yangbiense]|uniref:F-box domain-containing protein n=1 Tax=Acer yangbiense TaxID=1000413 RepID=A0A5C7INY7_9ROSI|nr:hypothetical protein EZV62_005519 [Acer yangbiense]
MTSQHNSDTLHLTVDTFNSSVSNSSFKFRRPAFKIPKSQFLLPSSVTAPFVYHQVAALHATFLCIVALHAGKANSQSMSSVNSNKKLNSIADNDDILTEILVRLPLKSILRCKSVSRQWRALISGPHFCRRIYPDAYLVSGLLLLSGSLFHREYEFVPLTDKPTSPPFKTLTFVNHPSGLEILQSCHGLLFCSSFNKRDFGRDYYIYNPTTKQFRTLPLPPGCQDLTIVSGMTLAYDPHKSPHYKVVCVRESDSWQDYLGIYSQLGHLNPSKYDHHCVRMGYYSRHQIEVYSSETRSWKLFGRPCIVHYGMDFRKGVFWNGAVHWVNYFSPSLYFKVDDEKLRKMPMPATPNPDDWKSGRRFMHLVESREHLHLFEIYRTTKFDVYELKTDYSGWFVKYQVDLDSITVAFPEMISTHLHPSDFAILDIIREADDEESYMVLHIPGKLIRYNLNDKTFNMIYGFSPGLIFDCFDAYHYIETVASI